MTRSSVIYSSIIPKLRQPEVNCEDEKITAYLQEHQGASILHNDTRRFLK